MSCLYVCTSTMMIMNDDLIPSSTVEVADTTRIMIVYLLCIYVLFIII